MKSSTERLRALLDERGVEWWKSQSVTMWGEDEGGEYRYMAAPFYVDGRLRVYGFTPEQAVEATLGRGTCKVVSKPCDMWECECGKAWWHGGAPNYCPSCGREVVVS